MKTAEETQQSFDFLVPFTERRTLFSVQEVAKMIQRTETFVYAEVDAGRFEAHGTHAPEKTRLRITRRSVLAWLAETAQYEPEYFIERIERLLGALNAAQLTRVVQKATQLRTRL